VNENQQALEAYMGKMATIANIVAHLQDWVDDMGNVSPDDVDWTHVGNLAAVLEGVTNAAHWANIDLTTEAAA